MSHHSDYNAQKILHAVTIDGNVEKPVWQKANLSKRFVDMASGDAALYNTQTAIVWNDTHLPDKWSRICFDSN